MPGRQNEKDAVSRLLEEVQKGWDSVQTESDWVSLEDVCRHLGLKEID